MCWSVLQEKQTVFHQQTYTVFKEKHQTVCREPYLHSLGDLVHILGLDDGPQVVLQDLGEIVLELRAPEVGQDLLPIGGVLRETGVPVRKGLVNLFGSASGLGSLSGPITALDARFQFLGGARQAVAVDARRVRKDLMGP